MNEIHPQIVQRRIKKDAYDKRKADGCEKSKHERWGGKVRDIRPGGARKLQRAMQASGFVEPKPVQTTARPLDMQHGAGSDILLLSLFQPLPQMGWPRAHIVK